MCSMAAPHHRPYCRVLSRSDWTEPAWRPASADINSSSRLLVLPGREVGFFLSVYALFLFCTAEYGSFLPARSALYGILCVCIYIHTYSMYRSHNSYKYHRDFLWHAWNIYEYSVKCTVITLCESILQSLILFCPFFIEPFEYFTSFCSSLLNLLTGESLLQS